MTVLTANAGSVDFELVQEQGCYRWYYPDGTPTTLSADSVEEARRAFAFRGLRLAAAWILNPTVR